MLPWWFTLIFALKKDSSNTRQHFLNITALAMLLPAHKLSPEQAGGREHHTTVAHNYILIHQVVWNLHRTHT